MITWAWATTSLDNFWHAQSLPMWLALLAAVFFGVIVLVTLLRAEKSVANGALTVITLLAIGIAAAATIRGTRATGQGIAATNATVAVSTAALPALACLDDLAGDMVLAACEKVLFGSADAIAAAVSASAAKITQLSGFGDVARANAALTPDLAALRQSIEHDRYGLFAYVLQARDRCMPEACPFYASLTDHRQITANMDSHVYEGLVTRYASGWNTPAAPPPTPAAAAASAAAVANPALTGNPALAGLPPSVPTGKPTTADFPSASSIPPVSIMTDTPTPPARSPAAASAQPAPHGPAKKQAPKARPQPAAPAEAVPLAPEGAEADKSGG
ncbi:MAG: hypothetical protein ABW213_14510 [Tardiphaga sp.]